MKPLSFMPSHFPSLFFFDLGILFAVNYSTVKSNEIILYKYKNKQLTETRQKIDRLKKLDWKLIYCHPKVCLIEGNKKKIGNWIRSGTTTETIWWFRYIWCWKLYTRYYRDTGKWRTSKEPFRHGLLPLFLYRICMN